MNLLELIENHSTEQSCHQAFKEHRELLGIMCKNCQCKNHKWDEKKNLWHCQRCKFRTTLRSGTVLQHSKMPFRIWFQVVAYMISTKKGFSAKEVQRLTNHKRYEPIWLMMHKIRKQMGQNIMYFDAFEHLISGSIQGIRDGAKSESKEIQIETLTINLWDNEPRAIATKNIKMKLLKSKNAVMSHFEENSFKKYLVGSYPETLRSDRRILKPKNGPQFAFKCLENVQKIIQGIHHHVKVQYLQNYLDEFCFKFNRKDYNKHINEEVWQYLISPKWGY